MGALDGTPEPRRVSAAPAAAGRRRRLAGFRVPGVWVATVLLFILGFCLEPKTFSANQVLNVLMVTSFLGIVAIGQAVVILTGGIDLSVSGVVTLINIVTAKVMLGDTGRMIPTVALCLGIGLAIGVVNGLLVTKARITPLIVTLAMWSVLFGTALLITGGIPSGGVPKEFMYIGQGRFFEFPVAAIIWIALTIGFVLLTRRTVYGRRVYAVGSNARAANMAGVPVDPTLISAYALSGLTAAIAGLVITAYIGLPALGSGDKYQLLSIAAVAVGGTALSGGIGGVALTAGGALFMTELQSITNVIHIGEFQLGSGGQFLIQGAAILLGTAFFAIVRRRRVAVPTLDRTGATTAPQ
ncbi:MAG TPA: ABC transporter permease [Propionibacteriaceae bacterium]